MVDKATFDSVEGNRQEDVNPIQVRNPPKGPIDSRSGILQDVPVPVLRCIRPQDPVDLGKNHSDVHVATKVVCRRAACGVAW
jgi:hypothetical protein